MDYSEARERLADDLIDNSSYDENDLIEDTDDSLFV